MAGQRFTADDVEQVKLGMAYFNVELIDIADSAYFLALQRTDGRFLALLRDEAVGIESGRLFLGTVEEYRAKIGPPITEFMQALRVAHDETKAQSA